MVAKNKNSKYGGQKAKGIIAKIRKKISNIFVAPDFKIDLEEDDKLLVACHAMSQKMGFDLSNISAYKRKMLQGVLNDDPVKRLYELADISSFRVHKIKLDTNWCQQSVLPIIVFHNVAQKVYLLLPSRRDGYQVVDLTDGSKQDFNADLIKDLQSDAYLIFKPYNADKIKLLDLLKNSLKRCQSEIMRIIGFSIVASLLSLIPPMLTALIFDDVIPNKDFNMFYQIGIILFALLLVNAVFSFTRSMSILRLMAKTNYSSQTAIWDRLLRLPFSFFQRFSSGDLMTRVMGIDTIASEFNVVIITTIVNLVFAIFYFILMLYYEAMLAWIALAFSLVQIAIMLLCSIVMIRLYLRPLLDLKGKITGFVLQLLNNIRKLRGCGSGLEAYREWSGKYIEKVRLKFKKQRFNNIIKAYNNIFAVVPIIVFYIYIVRFHLKLSIGSLISFLMLFSMLNNAISALGNILSELLTIKPIYERMRPILETAPEEGGGQPGLDSNLVVDNLSFQYEENLPLVLRDISIDIKPGEFVAVVGPSGSGKTTLLRLMLGFYEPAEGSICYGNTDLTHLNKSSLRKQCGIVLASSRLMAASIFDNIVAGNSNITKDQVWAVCKLVGLDEFISALPMGMHTLLLENASISGGQIQQVMIARALVNKPKIMFLDEATSHLDDQSQNILTCNLEKLSLTRIVCAHRLSTIVNADRIYVLEAGRLVEQGTYKELSAKEGVFANLIKGQII